MVRERTRSATARKGFEAGAVRSDDLPVPDENWMVCQVSCCAAGLDGGLGVKRIAL